MFVPTLDLLIEEKGFEEGARTVLRLVRPDWKAEDIVFKSYTAGITNKLLGCRLRSDTEYDDSILIRVFGAKTEIIIDREIEKVSMYILNKAGCGKPLYAEFKNGLAYGFIAGSCLDADTTRDDKIGRLVAEEMVKVSAIEPTKYADGLPVEPIKRLGNKEPCLFPKMRRYLAEAPTSFPDPERTEILKRDIASPATLANEINILEEELSALGSPVVMAHNDLLLNNIVYNTKDERCYYIDYEYMGRNYQAYDIGNHFCEWAGVDEVDYNRYPDKDKQMAWLQHFLRAYKAQQGHSDATPTQLELEKLYVQTNKFALAAHMFWGVWALIQARYSSIDFDYLDYAKIRLAEYFRRKEEFLALKMPA